MKSLLRWIGRALLAIVLLLVAALAVFRILSLTRERQTADQAAPPTGHFVSAGGVRVYVQEDGPGDGVPVALIHGFGAWSETWKHTTSLLAARGFHTVAMDVPPFGFSERISDGSFSRQAQARRILQVLDALQLKEVVLVGHSIGGRPTVEAALLAPDRIRALVLVDIAMGFGNDGEFEASHPSTLSRAFFAVHPLRNAVMAATATNPLMMKKLLGTFVADPRVLTPSLLAIYSQPLVVKDSTNRLGDWLEVVSAPDDSLSSQLANLAKLTMPTLLIWGDRDTITPPWQGEKLQKTIRHSSLLVLKGLGHIPQIEDSARFNAALLPFLESVRQMAPGEWEIRTGGR